MRDDAPRFRAAAALSFDVPLSAGSDPWPVQPDKTLDLLGALRRLELRQEEVAREFEHERGMRASAAKMQRVLRYYDRKAAAARAHLYVTAVAPDFSSMSLLVGEREPPPADDAARVEVTLTGVAVPDDATQTMWFPSTRVHWITDHLARHFEEYKRLRHADVVRALRALVAKRDHANRFAYDVDGAPLFEEDTPPPRKRLRSWWRRHEEGGQG